MCKAACVCVCHTRVPPPRECAALGPGGAWGRGGGGHLGDVLVHSPLSIAHACELPCPTPPDGTRLCAISASRLCTPRVHRHPQSLHTHLHLSPRTPVRAQAVPAHKCAFPSVLFSPVLAHLCAFPPPVSVCTCAFTPHFCTCTCVCPQSSHNERTSVLAHPCAFLCPLFLHTHAHLHPQSLHARAHLSPCTPMHVHTHPLHVHVPCTTAPYLHTQHLHGNVCPHARVSLRGGGGKVTMRGPHGTPR